MGRDTYTAVTRGVEDVLQLNQSYGTNKHGSPVHNASPKAFFTLSTAVSAPTRSKTPNKGCQSSRLVLSE